MSDLFSVLKQASASIDTQQSVTATLSNNISNADTPGYSLQVANLTEIQPAYEQGNSYIGQGVTLQSVTQQRNQFIEAQLPASFGAASSSSAAASTLTSLSALDPNATGSLANTLGAFYSALETLSQNPGNEGTQQAAVGAAQSLALSFNDTSQAITAARDGVDTQLTSDVPQINSLASQIASLNGQIKIDKANGGEPNDLMDSRQQLQDQLEQLTGATPVADAAGDANLVLSNGESLVNGNLSATLSTTPDSTNDGHLAILYSPPDGSAATTVPAGTFGGTIGGLLSSRDGALETAQNQVDQLAYDVGNAVNTVQTSGYTGAGNAGQALFTLTSSAPGAAARIQVNAAISSDPSQLATATTATGGTGDASNVLNMLATEQQALSTGSDASATLASITASYGVSAQAAQSQSTQDATSLTQLQTLRASTSGVSVTDEMTQLDQTQRVYQALTQVVSTTDSMLNSLLEIT